MKKAQQVAIGLTMGTTKVQTKDHTPANRSVCNSAEVSDSSSITIRQGSESDDIRKSVKNSAGKEVKIEILGEQENDHLPIRRQKMTVVDDDSEFEPTFLQDDINQIRDEI